MVWQVREGLTISGPRFSYHVEHHKLGSAVHLLALSRMPEKQSWHSGQTPRWATRNPLQTTALTPLTAGSAGSSQLSFEPLLRNHSQLIKASLLKVMFFLGSACPRDGWMWGIKIQPSPLKLGKFQKVFSFSVPHGVSWGFYQDFITAQLVPLHTCFLSFSSTEVNPEATADELRFSFPGNMTATRTLPNCSFFLLVFLDIILRNGRFFGLTPSHLSSFFSLGKIWRGGITKGSI